MTKVSKILFVIIIIAVIILMPLLSLVPRLNTDNEWFIKEVELRTATDIEAVKESIDKIETFEDFFKDSLPFRRRIINVYSNAYYNIGVSVFDSRVTIGKNDYLFYSKYENYHRGMDEYTDEEITEALGKLDVVNDYLIKKGIAFTYVTMPDKASIYGEYLPDWYTTTDQPSANRAVLNLTKASKDYTFVIDVTDELIKEKEIYGDALYYKTDTHYSSLGAYICYANILENLNEIYNLDLNIAELDSYTVVENAEGYGLKNLGGLKKNVNDFTTKLILDGIEVEDAAQWKERDFSNENALNDKTLLFFGDSFTRLLIAPLAQTFDKTYFHLIDHITEPFDTKTLIELVDKYDPDIVIIESMEMYSFNRLKGMNVSEGFE